MTAGARSRRKPCLVNGGPQGGQALKTRFHTLKAVALALVHDGAQIRARVLTPRAAQLNALMPYKAPPDLSRFLLSPMPGLLVDIAVQPGQSVRAGEKLAAIEAMKMENILVAAQDCVVEEIAAKQGESLAVDQIIMRFK